MLRDWEHLLLKVLRSTYRRTGKLSKAENVIGDDIKISYMIPGVNVESAVDVGVSAKEIETTGKPPIVWKSVVEINFRENLREDEAEAMGIKGKGVVATHEIHIPKTFELTLTYDFNPTESEMEALGIETKEGPIRELLYAAEEGKYSDLKGETFEEEWVVGLASAIENLMSEKGWEVITKTSPEKIKYSYGRFDDLLRTKVPDLQHTIVFRNPQTSITSPPPEILTKEELEEIITTWGQEINEQLGRFNLKGHVHLQVSRTVYLTPVKETESKHLPEMKWTPEHEKNKQNFEYWLDFVKGLPFRLLKWALNPPEEIPTTLHLTITVRDPNRNIYSFVSRGLTEGETKKRRR